MPASTKARVFRAHIPVDRLELEEGTTGDELLNASLQLAMTLHGQRDGVAVHFFAKSPASRFRFRISVIAREINMGEDGSLTPGIVTIKGTWSGKKCNLMYDTFSHHGQLGFIQDQ